MPGFESGFVAHARDGVRGAGDALVQARVRRGDREGRFDDVAYAFNTTTGKVRKIKVGAEPHGIAVWPQPGRYSLGHTGIMR